MKRLSVAPEEADIVDLSHEARGVARVDGKAVFVADALPGERVLMRRVGRRRNFDEAVLEQVLRASPDRVPAECPHFGLCGGCALQHLAPAAHLAFKQAQLLENLARLGGVEPGRVLETLKGPAWAYRRRARLGVKLVPRKGRVLVGFRERSAPYVADLHECRVLAPPAGRAPEVCANPPVNGVDQRGFARPGTGHPQCSIGAYEADGFLPESCVGDCDGTGSATVNELITLVNIALGNAQASACPHGVPSGANVDVALILQAVNVALNGCGG